MKFLSLKVIPALILLTIFAPAKVESSMKDKYNKKLNNENSCSIDNAGYIKNHPATSGYGAEPAWKEYFCVLDNGAIIKIIDRPGKGGLFDPYEFGNLNKTNLEKPQDYGNYISSGYRREYSIENNSLVEYRCNGYYACENDPYREVIATKYYPKTTSKNTSNNNYYAMYMDKGKKFYQQGNYSDAKSYFGQAVSSKKSAEAYLMRGFSNYMLKDYISAIYDFGRVNEITPKNSNAYLYMGLSQILGEEESQNKLEILKGCQNINKAKELGSKAASNFLSKKNLCISLLERN